MGSVGLRGADCRPRAKEHRDPQHDCPTPALGAARCRAADPAAAPRRLGRPRDRRRLLDDGRRLRECQPAHGREDKRHAQGPDPGWNSGPRGLDRRRRFVQRVVRWFDRFGLQVAQDRRRQRQDRLVALRRELRLRGRKLFKAATTYATPPSAGTDSKGAALMRLVSADRKALGKSSLAIDPSLVAIARNAPFACPTKSSLTITGRARDMAVRAYFSHDIKGCRHSDGTAYRAREILAVAVRLQRVAQRDHPLEQRRNRRHHVQGRLQQQRVELQGRHDDGLEDRRDSAAQLHGFVDAPRGRVVDHVRPVRLRLGEGAGQRARLLRVPVHGRRPDGAGEAEAHPDAGTDPSKLANASCSVNLRTKATTSATRKATIALERRSGSSPPSPPAAATAPSAAARTSPARAGSRSTGSTANPFPRSTA